MKSKEADLTVALVIVSTVAIVLWSICYVNFGSWIAKPAEAKVAASGHEDRWYTHEDWEVVTQCISSYPDTDMAAGEKCLGKVLRDGKI